MRYVSTRRYNSAKDDVDGVTFEEALTAGYAPDKGLYVPHSLPQINLPMLKEFATMTYAKLAYSVLRMFISSDEIANNDLLSICADCFHPGNGWDIDNIVPVQKLNSDDDNSSSSSCSRQYCFITELFHGPTHCFKDLSMQIVISLLSHFSSLNNRRTTVLVSTTGDTGPAATAAVMYVDNTLLNIVVYYPLGQISAFQKKQLTTTGSDRVHVIAFEGGGDDMDLPIKNILTREKSKRNDKNGDGGLVDDNEGEKGQQKNKKEPCLCGINSYNIGRPLAQMVHFIWTYLRVMEQMGLEIGDPDVRLDVVLPTGAMGNIAGGYMAKKMGLPIGKLCAGVNVNDITHRTIEHGEFHKSAVMEKTLSDAINIQVPYNFERILYYLTDSNPTLVRQWMTTMDTTEKLSLDTKWHEKLRSDFRSARITHEEMCIMLKRVRICCGYIADPHTSVALAAAVRLGYVKLSSSGWEDDGGVDGAGESASKSNGLQQKQEQVLSEENEMETETGAKVSKRNPVAIFATASPCKFEEAVTQALTRQGWQEYVNSQHYPKRAKDTMCREEKEAGLYTREKGSSLEAVQKKWEAKARKLIDSL